MKKSVIFLGLGIILAGAVIGAILVQKASVAAVNGMEISASEFEQQLNVFMHYTGVLRSAQGLTNEPDAATVAELRRLTLDSMIEQELIRAEAVRRLGADALVARVQSRLQSATSTEAIADAVTTLYGVSNREFEEIVLTPLARQELLLEEFGGDIAAFEAWLVSERTAAEVVVYAEDLMWSAGQVIRPE